MLPWQLRCGPLFRNVPLLIRLPLLLKQFYKVETFSLFLLQQQYLAKLCARAFLNGSYIVMIVSLI